MLGQPYNFRYSSVVQMDSCEVFLLPLVHVTGLQCRHLSNSVPKRIRRRYRVGTITNEVIVALNSLFGFTDPSTSTPTRVQLEVHQTILNA